jgi:protein O-mannosyl-transferase
MPVSTITPAWRPGAHVGTSSTRRGARDRLAASMSQKSARLQGRSFPFLALGALVLIVLTVFWPSLHSQFVYDSGGEIVTWDYIHDPGNLLTPLTFRLMSLDVLDFNRPVAVTSLMFDSLLWGREPFGYHLTNILLHAATACLVFIWIRHLLSSRRPARPDRDSFWRDGAAFLATLLFIVHPVVTEAVCEPSNRKDLLAALFGLTALLLAMRHRPGMGPGDPLRMFLCPLLCLLAIGSKEVGVAYPVILAFYWFLFRRGEPGKFWAWIILSAAAVDVVFLCARFALAHNPSEVFIDMPKQLGGSMVQTLLLQPRILALYLVDYIWPAWLCADYGPYNVRLLPLSLSLFLLALVAGLLGWWSRKDRRVLFAAGFIVVTVLPVCNLVPIYHPAADRYLYNPLIGIVLLVAIALDHDWLAASFVRRASAFVMVLVVVGLLLPVTLDRERAWSSEVALWQDTMDRNPQSFPAWVNLPEALLDAGQVEKAEAQTRAALKTPYAHNPWVWFIYAIELNRLGDRLGAEKAARQAVALKPDIGDGDKMVRTLQSQRKLTAEFTPIAAAARNSKDAP